MSRELQTVRLKRGAKVVHVETPLGIVNIHLGLHDHLGRRVENVSISGNNYAGEPRVVTRGTRLVELKTVKGGR